MYFLLTFMSDVIISELAKGDRDTVRKTERAVMLCKKSETNLYPVPEAFKACNHPFK